MALAHARPSEVIGLSPASEADGPGTAALVKTDRFEAVRLVVRKGTEIPSHKVRGYVTLYCVEGCIELGPSGIELGAGDWVYLKRAEPHSVRDIEDSVLLLTIHFD